MSENYRDAVAAWAAAAWQGSGAKARARVDKLARKAPLQQVAERFALDDEERQLIELAWAVERSAEAAKAAGALTVGKLREVVGEAADAKLAPGAKLRRRGLLIVEDGWLGGAAAPVRLGAGLAQRLDGEAASTAALGPGARRIPAGADGWHDRFPATARVAELVREQLAMAPELLLVVEACGRREAIALAAASARTFKRGVILLDGEALAQLPGAAFLLAAARRDADLDGDLLVILQAGALGEAWRAAAPEPAEGAKSATFVVLADSTRVPDVALDEGLAAHAVVWQSTAVAVATGAVASAAAKPKQDEDGFDYIRQLAVRDAERALGVIRKPEPPKREVQVAANPGSVGQGPVAADTTKSDITNSDITKSYNPAAPPSANPANASAASANAAAAPTEHRPQFAATNPVNAAQTAPAQPATPGEKPKVTRRSKKGMLHFGDPSAEAPRPAPVAAPTPQPVAPPPPAITTTTATADSTAASPKAGDAASTAPYVDVPADAAPDVLARIAATCPNPNQRIELIYKMGGMKTSSVVASLRANAKSEHTGVRGAAEAVMAAMFGPDWNRTRAVPKPVQPPRSDDKDRGPPGGF